MCGCMGVCFGWLVSWSSVGGRVEELCAGELLGKLVGWLVGSLASGLVGRWVGRLVGRLFGWRVGGLVGGLVNVAHWLVAAVCCLLLLSRCHVALEGVEDDKLSRGQAGYQVSE